MGRSITLVNVTRKEYCGTPSRDHDGVVMQLLHMLRSGHWTATDEIFSYDDEDGLPGDMFPGGSENGGELPSDYRYRFEDVLDRMQ
ncbi:Hypothetical protein UVM_LOCUS260 [uncultured virus]|nr:Hypothetical protein UVM_LOCUS260 [uncultured virus]